MKHPILQAGLILLLSMTAAAITWWLVDPPEIACDPSTIKPGEICLQDIPADATVLWIDARSREDWKKNGHPDALLWNFDKSENFAQLEQEAVLKMFNSQHVVIYCSDKGCGTSHELADYIKEKFGSMDAEINVLHDGWKALAAAGMVSSAE